MVLQFHHPKAKQMLSTILRLSDYSTLLMALLRAIELVGQMIEQRSA